jgi:hypothetical protein
MYVLELYLNVSLAYSYIYFFAGSHGVQDAIEPNEPQESSMDRQLHCVSAMNC